MAKIKLVSPRRTHVPDVKFDTDDGKIVRNRELPEAEQVKCEIKMANPEERTLFVGSYSVSDVKKKKTNEIKMFSSFMYETCMTKNVGKISGLEDFGITNGITLYNKSSDFQVVGEIVHDLFMKICGFHEDDKEDDDYGEMKEGE